MRLERFWQIADAIDCYTDFLQTRKDYSVGIMDYTPILETPFSALQMPKRLQSKVIALLGKISKAFESSVDAESKDLSTRQVARFFHASNEIGLELSIVDALKATVAMEKVVETKPEKNIRLLKSVQVVQSEVIERITIALALMEKTYGGRSVSQDPAIELQAGMTKRLESFHVAHTLSMCPPSMLRDNLVPRLLTVFRKARWDENWYMDAVYPVVSSSNTMWRYFIIEDLDDLIVFFDGNEKLDLKWSIDELLRDWSARESGERYRGFVSKIRSNVTDEKSLTVNRQHIWDSWFSSISGWLVM